MKIVDSLNADQLLVAVCRQLIKKLTHKYPTIPYQDIQDAVYQATLELLIAGGIAVLLSEQTLYQYLLNSAQRNIWHTQKRAACMVRLENIEPVEYATWIDEGMRADESASQRILWEVMKKQIGQENATIVWRYVMNNDKPQELAEDFGLNVGAVYARLHRNLKKLECLFTPPPRQIWIKSKVSKMRRIFFVSDVEFSVSCSSIVIEGAPHSLNPQHLTSQRRYFSWITSDAFAYGCLECLWHVLGGDFSPKAVKLFL